MHIIEVKVNVYTQLKMMRNKTHYNIKFKTIIKTENYKQINCDVKRYFKGII